MTTFSGSSTSQPQDEIPRIKQIGVLTESQQELLDEIYLRLARWGQGYFPAQLRSVARRWKRQMEREGLVKG